MLRACYGLVRWITLPRKLRQARSIFSPLSVLAIASLALAVARGQSSATPPAAPSQELFPGITATQAKENFPGIPAKPIDSTPLSGPPAVLALEHRPAAQMRAEDTAVVASMTTELSEKARIAGFDISGAGWEYEQIVCPAFPDYVFLAFSHGAEDDGSSRFVAALERNAPWVRVVSTVSSGTFPLERPGRGPASTRSSTPCCAGSAVYGPSVPRRHGSRSPCAMPS